MAFQLLINGVDYTNPLELRSLRISESTQVRGFTLEGTIQIQSQAVATPLAGSLVQFYRDGTLEFAGRLASVEQQQVGTQPYEAYKLHCVDFTVDLDMTVLRPRSFGLVLAGDIIRTVIGLVGRGITSVGVDNGVVVNIPFVEYETPSQLLSRIAESIQFQWYVDYTRDVQFFFIRDRPAPVATINVDTDTNTYDELTVDEQWEQVKNRLYLTGAKVRSTNPDTISATADGATKFFPLGYEPFQIGDVNVTVNGTPQTLALDTVAGQAGDGESAANKAYVCIDNWGVRFPDGSPPPAAANVAISYLYATPSVVVVDDPTSIALMMARENVAGAPSTGVHETKFDVPDLRVTSYDTIWEYGQLLLLRYKDILFNAKFHSILQGWRPGQSFDLYSAPSNRNIDQTMYVTHVTKSVRSVVPALFDYEIEALSSPFPG